MKKRQKSMTRSLICVAAVLAAIFAVMLLPRFAMVACAAADGTSADTAYEIGLWGDLEAAMKNDRTLKRVDEDADNPTYYRLNADCTASGSDSYILVGNGRHVVLDLAGHKIDRNLDAAKNDGHVMGIDGTLTLTDSSGNDSGRITGGNGKYGGGVSVGGTFNMTGGTISGNEATWGGGVYVVRGGTFSMTGGTISGNEASQGGGVYVSSSGKFNMTGGTISGNEAIQGGGVCVSSSGTFNMTGGTISGNEAFQGGGVCVSSSGTFSMTGGAITGNNGRLEGGGVYCQNSSSVFSISGDPVIRGNVNDGSKNEETGLYTSYELRGEENVWLPSDTFISVIAKPASAMQVGVTTENTPTDDTSVTFAKGTEGNDGY
ncbi:MAG: hypothetical protein K6C95_05000, partial [Lachnospiraceae bacterium]|nr:hypothetical protein [Lachnospiraceae bacterium]